MNDAQFLKLSLISSGVERVASWQLAQVQFSEKSGDQKRVLKFEKFHKEENAEKEVHRFFWFA